MRGFLEGNGERMLRSQDDYSALVSEVGQAVGHMGQKLARCLRLYRGRRLFG